MAAEHAYETIRYEPGTDGVVTLVLDDPSGATNTMRRQFAEDFARCVARLHEDRVTVTGVLLTSAKKTFFAGGNLEELRTEPNRFLNMAEGLRGSMRALEQLDRPVVAAIGGAALGGGLELALACHARIALAGPGTILGTPEVTLGLLPGAGGCTRIPRMLGIVTALRELLLPGKPITPERALELGLIDVVVKDRDALHETAHAWLLEHPDARQPWDMPEYAIPGGVPRDTEELRDLLTGHRASDDATQHITAAVLEGAQRSFDEALRLEADHFGRLIRESPQWRGKTRALFLDHQIVARQQATAPAQSSLTRVAALAVTPGTDALATLLARQDIAIDMLVSPAAVHEPATDGAPIELAIGYEQLADCDLVLAPPPSSHDDPVWQTVRLAAPGSLVAVVAPTAASPVWASDTHDADRVVGLNLGVLGSATELIEVIRRSRTSEQTVQRAVALVRLLGRSSIVVDDTGGRGYTARLVRAVLWEALAVVAEGTSPLLVERAALVAGFRTPPLELADQVGMHALLPEGSTTQAATDHPGPGVAARMVQSWGRPGRRHGAGFYEYNECGDRRGLWSGLFGAFGDCSPTPLSGDIAAPRLEELGTRMIAAACLEGLACLDEGALPSLPAANVASIRCGGLPSRTGGAFEYIDQRAGGVPGFLALTHSLSDRHGSRFRPPTWLENCAETKQSLRVPEECGPLR